MGTIVLQRKLPGRGPQPRNDGAGIVASPLHPAGLGSVTQAMRPPYPQGLLVPRAALRVPWPLSLEWLTVTVLAAADTGGVAAIYRFFFPAAWAGDDPALAVSGPHGTPDRGLVRRLIARMARADLFPLLDDEGELDEQDVWADEEESGAEGVPRYVVSIPVWGGWDYCWEARGLQAGPAEALLYSIAGVAEYDDDRYEAAALVEGWLRGEQDAGPGEVGRDPALWSRLEQLLGRAARRDERRARAQGEVAAQGDERVGADAAAVWHDVAGAFARAGEPWANVPRLARYMSRQTGNYWLDTDDTAWAEGGADDQEWSLCNVYGFAREWARARVLHDQIDAALAALAAPGGLPRLLELLEGTLP